MIENFNSIEFIKEGPNCEFVLFGSKPDHDEVIRQGLEKAEEGKLKEAKYALGGVSLIGLLVLIGVLANDMEFKFSFGLLLPIMSNVFINGAFIIRKRVDLKKGITTNKLDQYKRTQPLRTESLQ